MIRTIMALGLAACMGTQAPAQDEKQSQGRAQGTESTTGAQEKGQRFAARLAGTYRIVSGRSRGQEIPKDRLDTRVTIRGNVMTIYDRDEKELYVVEFRPAARGDAQGQGQPRQKGRGMGRRILLKTVRSTRPNSEGTEARGLIRVEGDTVTLVYDYSAAGHFPEGFETQVESQNLFVLRKDAGSGDAAKSAPEETKKDQP